MMCHCKQKTDGVLLYWTGTDLRITLSKTLKLLGNSAMTLLGLDPDKEYFVGETEDNERQLFSFCNKINDRIHRQINTISKNYATTPYDISEFNLQLCIDSIDPLLWKMVVLLTRSVSEARKQISFDSISHQRKLQCLYTLCVIFFNTNRTCSVPMHLLLTVLVEAHGAGSSELIRLLNSVGAIASADTHQRYIQFKIERKHRSGISSELNMTNFSIVSVDNIDFLQRHAFVYCGDQSRSWHGTTVQVVQPLPLQTQCHSSQYVDDGSRERDTQF